MRNKAAWLTLLALVYASTWWLGTLHMYSHPWDHDEGVYMASARLVAKGEPLFARVFSSQPPVFLSSLATWVKVFGDSNAVGRLYVGFAGVIALLCLAILGSQFWGRGSRAWIIFIGSGSYIVSKTGHLVGADLPAVSLALLSMVVAIARPRFGVRFIPEFLTGVIFSLAVLTKLLAAPMLIPVALLLVVDPHPAGWRLAPWRSVVARLALMALGGTLTTVGVMLCYDRAALLDQAFLFHISKRASTGNPFGLGTNLGIILNYVGREIGLVGLALVAAQLLWKQRDFVAGWVAAWMFAVLGFCLVHTPLLTQHTLLVLVPTGLMAAVAASHIATRLGTRIPPWSATVILGMVSLICVDYGKTGISVYGKWKVSLMPWRNYWNALYVEPDPQEAAASRLIASLTSADEYAVSDSPKLVYFADRMSTPYLVDIGLERLQSGWLKADRSIASALDAKVILFWTIHLREIPGFYEWTKAHYSLAHDFGEGRELYVRRQPQE